VVTADIDGHVYDLAVIGSGPAGEKGAAHAAYFGRSVAMVERDDQLGGVVVNSAGIPTKTLRETALYITGFHRREIYGVSIQTLPDLTLRLLGQRMRSVRRTMTAQVRASMERHGVDVIHGTARLVGPRSLSITSPDGTVRILEARAVLVATGSRPFHPPGLPLDDPDVHDSETILSIDAPIESAVIIGSGAVGSEYASIMAALGVRVTLLEAAPRILGIADADMSAELARCMTAAGIDVRAGTSAHSIAREDGRLVVTLSTGDRLFPTKVLFAVGRSANTEGLGLEELGVALDERRSIVVDDHYRTNVPSIYAAGDVVGPPGLASVSAEQGRVAASAACGTAYAASGRYVAPSGVYTVPEVAWVGLTEEQARAGGVAFEVGRAGFATNSRANIGGITEGMVKLLFDPTDRHLLGAHVVNEIAAEIIHIAQAVIQLGGDLEYFIHGTFNVPTWSDAFKAAAFDGLGKLEPSGLVRSALTS
jgi:NAD(P) transhydrogenase